MIGCIADNSLDSKDNTEGSNVVPRALGAVRLKVDNHIAVEAATNSSIVKLSSDICCFTVFFLFPIGYHRLKKSYSKQFGSAQVEIFKLTENWWK